MVGTKGNRPMFRFAIPLLLIGASAEGFQQDRSLDVDREKEVYAIYSLMLTNPQTSHGPYTSERFLIASATGPGLPKDPCVRPPKERDGDFQEVLADFESRKATPRQLKQAFSLGKPYLLLSPEEVQDFIAARRPTPGRKATDERFRGISDLITLSDVYFNRSGTLALTAISTFCGGLCGRSQWKVFEKVDSGRWEELPWATCVTVAWMFGGPGPERLGIPNRQPPNVQ
jgi:hypothetical protein